MMLKAALWYRSKMNFSVIPIKTDGSKKPVIEWKQWQDALPSEEQIKQWWTDTPQANIGIVTGKISNISVMDFDWYKLKDEEKEKLNKHFPAVFTPTAYSPRGGEHRYLLYHPDMPTKNGVCEGLDIKNDGGYIIAPPSINGNGNYRWNDRAKITETELHKVPELYLKSLFLFISPAGGRVRVANAMPTTLNFNEGTRDETIFHIANVLAKGGMPELEMEQLLGLIACQCNPPFPEKEIPEKIKSALKRVISKEVNIMQEVRDFLAVTNRNFRVTDVSQAVTSVTKGSKAVLMALSRLCKDGLIERLDTPGTYRVVEKSESVNIRNVPEMTPQRIWLPFNLERYVTVYPGNLIIIAGVTNAGKSALILNMILNNMGLWKCWYFSTEMSAQTVRSRVNKGRDSVEWDFEIVENWDQTPDGLQPDALNFCDWIEAGEEPWKVTAKLDRIQKKLRKGIAVVAIQKNPGVEHGIGGFQTMAKAALYLTVDRKDRYDITKGQCMRVTKAKAYDEVNPNDFVCEFKIVQGIELLQVHGWGPEEEPEERYSQFPVTKSNKGNKR